MSYPMPATTIRFASAVPQFTVPDVVRTAEYYRDVLGFTIAGYWDGERVHDDAGAPAVFGIVRRDEVRLHFSRAEHAHVRAESAPEAYNVYFHVIGVEARADDRPNRGARSLDRPEDRVYGQRELIVSDCNGLILAFGEETRGRAA
jgi:catechol 2,3-dioxygenase-like lactoylglutathione lyase family enzyme